MFALLIAAAIVPQAERPASEILAENRLAIAVWPDARMRVIYTPYFDCYWDKVKTQPDSNLRALEAATKMFSEAQQSCTPSREVADREADKYLSRLSDYGSPVVRADVLPRYRRQVGFLTLAGHYREVGKADLFNDYLAKIGQAARAR
jgi:hypothetical protein